MLRLANLKPFCKAYGFGDKELRADFESLNYHVNQ